MTKKIILKIFGMDCGSCAANIEHTLRKEKGVILFDINLASEKASVEFDNREISLEKIKEIVKNMGYKAEEETYESMMEHNHDHHKLSGEKEIRKLKDIYIFRCFGSADFLFSYGKNDWAAFACAIFKN